MAKKNLLLADITPEIIEEWKGEFGKVHILSIAKESMKYDPHMAPTDEDEPIADALVGYICQPTDKQLSFAMSKLPAVLEAGKAIVKSCWLGGDEQIKTDTTLLTSAALYVAPLLEVRQGQLKEV